MKPKFPMGMVLLAVVCCGLHGSSRAQSMQDSHSSSAGTIDPRSYHLGEIEAFAEMVRKGVKILAISDVLTPDEAAALIGEAHNIAKRYGVQIYREPDLVVTDLFPEDVAKGKIVLLIYKGDTLAAYQRLKADKANLVAAGNYQGKARADIARRFGRLLSYPRQEIDRMLRSPQCESNLTT